MRIRRELSMVRAVALGLLAGYLSGMLPVALVTCLTAFLVGDRRYKRKDR